MAGGDLGPDARRFDPSRECNILAKTKQICPRHGHCHAMAGEKQQSEISIVTLLRSRVRILCPAVSLVAVPNAAKRTQWAAQRAKREGMATGFPDLMALAPGGKIAFLEIKTRTGRLREQQSEWLLRLHDMGFACGVFRDADAAVDFLRERGFPFVGRIAA